MNPHESTVQDQTCRALIDPRSSGYCECGGGRIIRKPGCVHGEWAEPFTCLDECAGQWAVLGWSQRWGWWFNSHVGEGFLATGVMRNCNKIQQRELLDDGQRWVG